MDFNYYTMLETNYCEVFIDKSRSNGILRFTHEISVLFQYSWVSNRWIFVVANEIGLEDVDYETIDEFEFAYPGLLDTITPQLADMRDGNGEHIMIDNLKREVLNYAKSYAKIIGLDIDGDFVKYKGEQYYVNLHTKEVTPVNEKQ